MEREKTFYKNIIIRTLEDKIGMAKNRGQNEILVATPVMDDILSILRDQQNDIAMLRGAQHAMAELLQDKEPVTPQYNARTNWYECGACHFSMTSGMHCRNELIPAFKLGFCSKCGRKQKWE